MQLLAEAFPFIDEHEVKMHSTVVSWVVFHRVSLMSSLTKICLQHKTNLWSEFFPQAGSSWHKAVSRLEHIFILFHYLQKKKKAFLKKHVSVCSAEMVELQKLDFALENAHLVFWVGFFSYHCFVWLFNFLFKPFRLLQLHFSHWFLLRSIATQPSFLLIKLSHLNPLI